jgi:Zn-dependent protease
MESSGLRIGTFAGAPVVMDWSVAILIAFIVGGDFLKGGAAALPGAFAWVAAIFVSILIHEFSHAGVAAALKLPSKVIVLTFFGGHVEFVRKPDKRWHDILVSAAGPLSNLLVAIVLMAVLAIGNPLDPSASSEVLSDSAGSLVERFLAAFVMLNLLLGIFNLLPGFPLDGGRMLSAALSYLMSPNRARIVAGVTGVCIALLAAWYGFAQGWTLTIVIGLFLLLGAMAEIGAARRALRAETV